MKLQPLVSLALVFVFGSVQPMTSASRSPTQQAMARIEALIGDAPCRNDGECRTIAAGQRACGGPDMYIAWSTRHTTAADIERAVAAFDAVGRATPPGRNVSICVYLHDPGAVCRPASGHALGHCELRPPSGASPSLPVR